MAITLVVDTFAQGNTGGSTTSGVDTTGANLIVVTVTYYAANPEPTLTDNKSNSPVTTLTAQTGNTAKSKLYYFLNPTVGTGHTFTVAGTTSYASLAILAFAGVKTSSPFDQQNGSGISTNVSSRSTGSVTPGESGEVIVSGGIHETTSGTQSIDSGFTKTAGVLTVGGTTFGLLMAYKIKTNATAENPTWSVVGLNGAWAVTIATFKSAAGGGVIPAQTLIINS